RGRGGCSGPGGGGFAGNRTRRTRRRGRDHGKRHCTVRSRWHAVRAGDRRRYDRNQLQSREPGLNRGHDRDFGGGRTGGAVRLDADEGGNRHENGAQHAEHGRHGQAGQDLREPHGRPAGDECKAYGARKENRAAGDRPVVGSRWRIDGLLRRRCKDGNRCAPDRKLAFRGTRETGRRRRTSARRARTGMTGTPLPLIIGVDGGGTKTAARVASVRPDGGIVVLGEGHGGPSNVRAVGPVHAKTNLDVAIDAAHEAAGTRNVTVDYAVLALAGSALPDVQSDIHDWAGRRALAAQVDIVHDAEPVLSLSAGTGAGVALIVGTGSVAIATDGVGGRAVIGGWGHWFGDQGSGFDIGRRALAAIAEAVDGIAPQTALVKHISERLQVEHPREITRRL